MQALTQHPDRPILAAAVLLAAALAPQPAGAQGSYYCQSKTPVEVCNDADTLCTYNYKDCFFDWDGLTETGYEQTARFYENRGTETNPPFGVDDRHCFQGESFDSGDDLPDSDDDQYGILRFALLLPVGNEDGPFPLFVQLRGAAAGWVDTAAGTPTAWTLEFSDPDTSSYEQGEYKGNLQLSQGVFNEGVMLDYLLDDDGLVDGIRDMDWALLVPSGCSHDGWNGREDLECEGNDCLEAERTRFGFDSVVEALKIVDDNFEIDYFFAGGSSGGGIGSFILADDLPGFGDRFRGAVMDAAAAEWDPWADLYAGGATIDVDSDSVCTDPDEATVPCEHPAEPLDTAFLKTGASGRSASQDIENGTAVPILHIWNTRDKAHCYDACYSNANLHGPIRQAIEDRKVGPIDEAFEFSENLETCVDSCRAGVGGPILNCVRHASLGERAAAPVQAVLDCALDWIEAVNTYWQDMENYETPASCEATIVENMSTSPPLCTDQGAIM